MLHIILWLAAFSLLHSITAAAGTKNWFIRTFGEYLYHGCYRLLYNAVALMMFLPVVPAILSENDIVYSIPAPLAWILLICQIAGLLGLVVSLLQIDWMQFVGITQLLTYLQGKPLPLPQEPLQTSGLYGMVRHPLYFFTLIVIWLMPQLSSGFLMMNILLTLYILIGSRVEEKRMLQVYGNEYASYMQNVPWLIPFLKKS